MLGQISEHLGQFFEFLFIFGVCAVEQIFQDISGFIVIIFLKRFSQFLSFRVFFHLRHRFDSFFDSLIKRFLLFRHHHLRIWLCQFLFECSQTAFKFFLRQFSCFIVFQNLCQFFGSCFQFGVIDFFGSFEQFFSLFCAQLHRNGIQIRRQCLSFLRLHRLCFSFALFSKFLSLIHAQGQQHDHCRSQSRPDQPFEVGRFLYGKSFFYKIVAHFRRCKSLFGIGYLSLHPSRIRSFSGKRHCWRQPVAKIIGRVDLARNFNIGLPPRPCPNASSNPRKHQQSPTPAGHIHAKLHEHDQNGANSQRTSPGQRQNMYKTTQKRAPTALLNHGWKWHFISIAKSRWIGPKTAQHPNLYDNIISFITQTHTPETFKTSRFWRFLNHRTFGIRRYVLCLPLWLAPYAAFACAFRCAQYAQAASFCERLYRRYGGRECGVFGSIPALIGHELVIRCELNGFIPAV